MLMKIARGTILIKVGIRMKIRNLIDITRYPFQQEIAIEEKGHIPRNEFQ